MSITAKSEGTGRAYEPVPAGTYIARCISMVHIGTIMDSYQGESKLMNKVRVTWELPTEQKVFSEELGEQPYVLGKEFNLSLNEKATLRKFLESWRGKPFTDQEAKAFDITVLLDKPCMLNVIHKTSKASGKTYAEIASVSPMMKGIQCPLRINDLFQFSYEPFEEWRFNELPEWLREKVKTSLEYTAIMKGHHETLPAQEDDNDETPF